MATATATSSSRCRERERANHRGTETQRRKEERRELATDGHRSTQIREAIGAGMGSRRAIRVLLPSVLICVHLWLIPLPSLLCVSVPLWLALPASNTGRQRYSSRMGVK